MITKLPFDPPQLTQFMDACWMEQYFSIQEIKKLIKQSGQLEKKAAEVTNEEKIDLSLRKSTVAFIEPGDEGFEWFTHRMAQIAIQTNYQRYNFDLMGIYEPIQIAEYTTGDFFDWHLDFSNESASNRKLSISIQLSAPEEYEGGDLQFMVNNKHVNAPRTRGTVIIFPSFIQHRVTPITKGSRKSVVGWITGAPFK